MSIYYSILYVSSMEMCYSQNIDVRILKAVNPQNPSSGYWDLTSKSVYWITGGMIAGHLVAGWIQNDAELKQYSYEAMIATGINKVLTTLGKRFINRQRPSEKYPSNVFVNTYAKDSSFPSGHTSLAFATATTLSLEYQKWYITVPAYLWATSVGYSRMYLGQHYPSDVLGGAIVGIGSAYVSHWINRKIFKN